MKRPLKDKRPIGPFIYSSNSTKDPDVEKFVGFVGNARYTNTTKMLVDEFSNELTDMLVKTAEENIEVGRWVWTEGEASSKLSWMNHVIGKETDIGRDAVVGQAEEIPPEAEFVIFVHTHPIGSSTKLSLHDIAFHINMSNMFNYDDVFNGLYTSTLVVGSHFGDNGTIQGYRNTFDVAVTDIMNSNVETIIGKLKKDELSQEQAKQKLKDKLNNIAVHESPVTFRLRGIDENLADLEESKDITEF